MPLNADVGHSGSNTALKLGVTHSSIELSGGAHQPGAPTQAHQKGTLEMSVRGEGQGGG